MALLSLRRAERKIPTTHVTQTVGTIALSRMGDLTVRVKEQVESRGRMVDLRYEMYA